ncbi:MAG: hypothetical protein ACRDSR_06315 [Pseudonocardiaceae bacterium]
MAVYPLGVGATVAAVADLGSNDVHRRDFLRTAPFVVAAAVAPSRDWLLATLDATMPRPGAGSITNRSRRSARRSPSTRKPM